MIDDVSTDSSTQIMDEYSEKYSNFVSIKLKENHKVAGAARNIGLEKAEGKYIMFADADDISDWALDAIQWVNKTKLVNGTGEVLLSPKSTATRAQVAAILMRFCENVPN